MNGAFTSTRSPLRTGPAPIKFHYSAPGFKPLETALTPRPGERQDLVFHFAPSGSSDESRVILTPEAASPAAGASPGLRPEVRIIDKELRRFEGSLTRIEAVAITPDGKRALAGGSGWPDPGLRSQRLAGSSAISRRTRTRCLLWRSRRTASQVLSAGMDPVVRLWDIASGHSAGTVYSGCTAPVVCVAFTPKGDYVCAGDAHGFRALERRRAHGGQAIPAHFGDSRCGAGRDSPTMTAPTWLGATGLSSATSRQRPRAGRSVQS